MKGLQKALIYSQIVMTPFQLYEHADLTSKVIQQQPLYYCAQNAPKEVLQRLYQSNDEIVNAVLKEALEKESQNQKDLDSKSPYDRKKEIEESMAATYLHDEKEKHVERGKELTNTEPKVTNERPLDSTPEKKTDIKNVSVEHQKEKTGNANKENRSIEENKVTEEVNNEIDNDQENGR